MKGMSREDGTAPNPARAESRMHLRALQGSKALPGGTGKAQPVQDRDGSDPAAPLPPARAGAHPLPPSAGQALGKSECVLCAPLGALELPAHLPNPKSITGTNIRLH